MPALNAYSLRDSEVRALEASSLFLLVSKALRDLFFMSPKAFRALETCSPFFVQAL